MSWSAKQYSLFEAERTRPVRDLLSAVPLYEVQTAVDLGCGPGNSTEVLRQRFPDATVSGVDSSADMITAARARLPDLQFDLSDISTWDAAGPFDVVLANAVVQWVPNHETLLPRLISKLAPGGTLALQMPDNLDEPTHRLMRETAAAGAWREKLSGAASARSGRHGAAYYYSLLKPHAARVDVWRTTYFHVLAGGPDDVVEWVKGTGLRPFLAPLDAAEAATFLAQYRAGVALAYPPLPDGSVLLPFPRLFIVATRPK
jgi:trans-aconitate 2-methyltransferase